MNTKPIDNMQDIIDSREVMQRITDLRDEWAEATGEDPDNYVLSRDDWSVGLGDDEADELVALMELAEEGETLADWKYGETLIRDSYFVDYARELAYDMGLVPREHTWPASYIDWESAARDLQTDYTPIEFDGVTYWGRA